MTNAQAALIAAATFAQPLVAGDRRTAADVVGNLASSWAAELDKRDAAQQATTAPQADEPLPTLCATCARVIEASPTQPGAWHDATGLWGNGDHNHQP